MQLPREKPSTHRFWPISTRIPEWYERSICGVGLASANRSNLSIDCAYIRAGNLNPFFGTEIAQMIFAEFEPETQVSKLLSLTVNLDAAGNFTLQPVRVTAATTIRGDSFGLQSDRQVLPFGETAYYRQNVLAGVGKRFLAGDYFDLVAKSKVADVDSGLALAAALNLISAASKATEIVAAPTRIGGGESAVLLSSDTQVLK